LDYTIIRPGGLKDGPPSGNIVFGKADTIFNGAISRTQVSRDRERDGVNSVVYQSKIIIMTKIISSFLPPLVGNANTTILLPRRLQSHSQSPQVAEVAAESIFSSSASNKIVEIIAKDLAPALTIEEGLKSI